MGDQQAIDHARQVGISFLRQYYMVLVEQRENTHLFYAEDSTLCFCSGTIFRGGKDIQSAYEKLRITEVDVNQAVYLPTNENGILVVAAGKFTTRTGVVRSVSQTFLLVSNSDKRYHVFSDVIATTEGKPLSVDDDEEEKKEVSAPTAQATIQPTSAPPTKTEKKAVKPPPAKTEQSVQEAKPAIDEPAPEESGTVGFSYASAAAKAATSKANVATPPPAVAQPAPSKTNKAGSRSESASNSRRPDNGDGNQSAQRRNDSGCALFVKELPKGVDQNQMKECFGVFGTVRSVELPPGKSFGFVNFTSPDAIKAALSAPQITIAGANVVVQQRTSTPPSRRSRGSGRSGGGRGSSGASKGQFKNATPNGARRGEASSAKNSSKSQS